MHDDLSLVQARLDRLAGAEDIANFFEGAAARLDEEEVDENEFEYVPEDEEEIVLFTL
jgi:hypothetical protein